MIFMSEFTSNIIHVHGVANKLTDALSYIVHFHTVTKVDLDALANLQKEDEKLEVVIRST
uniref:Uncharacterized protein n=1 Tax=Lepeophtheirus salmonis TaxID=72036 RepID=A0A0K2USA6_LEPSM